MNKNYQTGKILKCQKRNCNKHAIKLKVFPKRIFVMRRKLLQHTKKKSLNKQQHLKCWPVTKFQFCKTFLRPVKVRCFLKPLVFLVEVHSGS